MSSEYTQYGKAFACHSYPQKHETIHSGEKPYDDIQYGEAFVHHISLQMNKKSLPERNPTNARSKWLSSARWSGGAFLGLRRETDG